MPSLQRKETVSEEHQIAFKIGYGMGVLMNGITTRISNRYLHVADRRRKETNTMIFSGALVTYLMTCFKTGQQIDQSQWIFRRLNLDEKRKAMTTFRGQ